MSIDSGDSSFTGKEDIDLSDLRFFDPTDFELCTLARWLQGTYDNLDQRVEFLRKGVEEPEAALCLHYVPFTVEGLSEYGQMLCFWAEDLTQNECINGGMLLVVRTKSGQLISRLFEMRYIDDKRLLGSLQLQNIQTMHLKQTGEGIFWKAKSDPDNYSTSTTDLVLISLVLMSVFAVGLRFGLPWAAINALLTWNFFNKFLLARYKSPEMRFEFVNGNEQGYVGERVFVCGLSDSPQDSCVFRKR